MNRLTDRDIAELIVRILEVIAAIQHELEQRETDAYEDRC